MAKWTLGCRWQSTALDMEILTVDGLHTFSATNKSKRQYHPVRGQLGSASQSGGSEGEQEADVAREGEAPNDNMLRDGSEEDDDGDARDELMEGKRNGVNGGSVHAQSNGNMHRRSKYTDHRDEEDGDDDGDESSETAEEGENEKYSGRTSLNGYSRDGLHGRKSERSQGMKENLMKDEEEEEDVEEIDLTRDHLQPKYLRMSNTGSQFQQTRVMYLPSFGSLGPTSLSAVMGDLFSGAPSLDINEPDSGSDWTGKESVDGEMEAHRKAKPRTEDDNLAELFTILKQQHEEQTKAQQDHHREQLQWLRNQLLSGDKHGCFQNGDLNQGPSTSGIRPHVQGASTEKRESTDIQSYEKDTMHATGQVNIEEMPLLDQADDTSETSTFVSGSLDNTQMTTWSDVHDQKQGQSEDVPRNQQELGVGGFADPKLQVSYMWNRVANPKGEPGGNVGLDLVNLGYSGTIASSGKTAGNTCRYLSRSAQLSGPFGRDLHAMLVDSDGADVGELKRSLRTELHDQEIQRFTEEYQADALFDYIPGRQHSAFGEFESSCQVHNPKEFGQMLHSLSTTLDMVKNSTSSCEEEQMSPRDEPYVV